MESRIGETTAKQAYSVFPSEASHLEQHGDKDSWRCLWPIASSSLPSADPRSCVYSLQGKALIHLSSQPAPISVHAGTGGYEMQHLVISATAKQKPKLQDIKVQLTIALGCLDLCQKSHSPDLQLWTTKKTDSLPKSSSLRPTESGYCYRPTNSCLSWYCSSCRGVPASSRVNPFFPYRHFLHLRCAIIYSPLLRAILPEHKYWQSMWQLHSLHGASCTIPLCKWQCR